MLKRHRQRTEQAHGGGSEGGAAPALPGASSRGLFIQARAEAIVNEARDQALRVLGQTDRQSVPPPHDPLARARDLLARHAQRWVPADVAAPFHRSAIAPQAVQKAAPASLISREPSAIFIAPGSSPQSSRRQISFSTGQPPAQSSLAAIRDAMAAKRNSGRHHPIAERSPVSSPCDIIGDVLGEGQLRAAPTDHPQSSHEGSREGSREGLGPPLLVCAVEHGRVDSVDPSVGRSGEATIPVEQRELAVRGTADFGEDGSCSDAPVPAWLSTFCSLDSGDSQPLGARKAGRSARRRSVAQSSVAWSVTTAGSVTSGEWDDHELGLSRSALSVPSIRNSARSSGIEDTTERAGRVAVASGGRHIEMAGGSVGRPVGWLVGPRRDTSPVSLARSRVSLLGRCLSSGAAHLSETGLAIDRATGHVTDRATDCARDRRIDRLDRAVTRAALGHSAARLSLSVTVDAPAPLTAGLSDRVRRMVLAAQTASDQAGDSDSDDSDDSDDSKSREGVRPPPAAVAALSQLLLHPPGLGTGPTRRAQRSGQRPDYQPVQRLMQRAWLSPRGMSPCRQPCASSCDAACEQQLALAFGRWLRRSRVVAEAGRRWAARLDSRPEVRGCGAFATLRARCGPFAAAAAHHRATVCRRVLLEWARAIATALRPRRRFDCSLETGLRSSYGGVTAGWQGENGAEEEEEEEEVLLQPLHSKPGI